MQSRKNNRRNFESSQKVQDLIEDEELCEGGFIRSMDTSSWLPFIDSLHSALTARSLFGELLENRDISVKSVRVSSIRDAMSLS